MKKRYSGPQIVVKLMKANILCHTNTQRFRIGMNSEPF